MGIGCIGGDLDTSRGPTAQAIILRRCASVPGQGVDGESSQVGELVELVAGHGEQRIVGRAHAVCPLTGSVGDDVWRDAPAGG